MGDDLVFKFLAIGDSGVGKTSILNRFVDSDFNATLAPTVGVDIREKNLTYASQRKNIFYNIHLQLWDTAGQERFRSLTYAFFRDAIAFLLVFDVSNEASFINVRHWISEIHANTYSQNIDMILIGNKCDLEADRVISKIRAEEFSRQNDIKYIETSALHNIRVDEAIKALLDLVIHRFEQNQYTSKPIQNKIKISDDSCDEQHSENKTKPKKMSYCCSY